MKCSTCGFEYDDDLKRCPECGEINNGSNDANKQSGTKPVRLLMIGAGIILFSCCTAYAISRSGKPETDIEKPSASATEKVTLHDAETVPESNVFTVEENEPAEQEPDASESSTAIIVNDSDNNTYTLNEYAPVDHIDFSAIKDNAGKFKNLMVRDSETSKSKDISEIQDNDVIIIPALDEERNALRDLMDSAGVYRFKNKFSFGRRGNNATICYSSDNNGPFTNALESPVFYYETYSVDGHGQNMQMEYDIDVYNSDKGVLEYQLNYNLEDESREITLYREDFDGTVYEDQKFLGEYTNADGIYFLLVRKDRRYEGSDGSAKTYTIEFDAYAAEKGELHTIIAGNTMDLFEVETLPDHTDMISEDEFKTILDGLTK